MATDYLNALVGQLDPTKKKMSDAVAGGGFALPDGTNTGIAGNIVEKGAQPQLEPPKAELPAAAAGGIADTPAAAAPPAGPNYVSFAGFDGSKFGKDSKPGSKYTPDAAVFSDAIGSGVKFGRNDLGGLTDFYKQKGYGQATAVGDDKIDPDGPGPMGPIDVITSDGRPWYENTTGNPQWEAQYGGGGGGSALHGGGGAHGGGLANYANPMVQGDGLSNVNAALGKLGAPSDMLQQLIAQLTGGA